MNGVMERPMNDTVERPMNDAMERPMASFVGCSMVYTMGLSMNDAMERPMALFVDCSVVEPMGSSMDDVTTPWSCPSRTPWGVPWRVSVEPSMVHTMDDAMECSLAIVHRSCTNPWCRPRTTP